MWCPKVHYVGLACHVLSLLSKERITVVALHLRKRKSECTETNRNYQESIIEESP